MRPKNPSSKVIRLMSSWRSIDGHTHRWSRNRFQSSPAFMERPGSGFHGRQDGLALGFDRGQQLLERVDELLHALVLELLRRRGHRDADLAELRELPRRVFPAVPDAGRGLAVVAV